MAQLKAGVEENHSKRARVSALIAEAALLDTYAMTVQSVAGINKLSH
jgi:hypothetical protein